MDTSKALQPKQINKNDIRMNMIVAYGSQFTQKLTFRIGSIKPFDVDENGIVVRYQYSLYEPNNYYEKRGSVEGTQRLFKVNSILENQTLTTEFINQIDKNERSF
jgi:hypothetical protein